MKMTTSEVESRLTALEAEVAELRAELERSKIQAKMRRSIQQLERGEGAPAVEVATALARKHGISK
jgi:hypothetical protein